LLDKRRFLLAVLVEMTATSARCFAAFQQYAVSTLLPLFPVISTSGRDLLDAATK
jgi:hypothetical protein